VERRPADVQTCDDAQHADRPPVRVRAHRAPETSGMSH
jgi:hypothetical protein